MNIGKIIKITEATVYIGYEDGSLKEIAIESCDFEPSIGDYVEVYEGIVIKVDINKNNIEKKNQYKKNRNYSHSTITVCNYCYKFYKY